MINFHYRLFDVKIYHSTSPHSGRLDNMSNEVDSFTIVKTTDCQESGIPLPYSLQVHQFSLINVRVVDSQITFGPRIIMVEFIENLGM